MAARVSIHGTDAGASPKAELARVLARAGYSVSTIDELLAQLQEPIVSPRNGPVFGRYGISPEALMDRLGGSP
jgi:hypothetical protein